MNKFSSELKAKLNNKVFNIIRFDRLICTSLCKCEFESNGDQIEFRCKNYNLRIKSDAIRSISYEPNGKIKIRLGELDYIQLYSIEDKPVFR